MTFSLLVRSSNLHSFLTQLQGVACSYLPSCTACLGNQSCNWCNSLECLDLASLQMDFDCPSTCCPKDCSSHGDCIQLDSGPSCSCDAFWIGGDCSRPNLLMILIVLGVLFLAVTATSIVYWRKRTEVSKSIWFVEPMTPQWKRFVPDLKDLPKQKDLEEIGRGVSGLSV